MISLKDKVALITGASRGIGAATAVMFAKAGSHVVINFRTDEAAAKAVRSQCEGFGVRAVLARADVANRADVETMVANAVRDFGRVDILVANAGIWEYNAIDNLDDARLKRALDVNILGTFYPTMAVVPHMKRQRSGNIILISLRSFERGDYQPDQIARAGTDRAQHPGELRCPRLGRYRHVARVVNRSGTGGYPEQDSDGACGHR
jgi:3-oxoacyl-[acyl-carrier protein] reductase